MKELNKQNLRKFELGNEENMNFLIRIIIAFQQRNRQDSQNLKNDTFLRLPATSAQCVIGTEKHPDVGILLTYVDDVYSQGYGQIKGAIRALKKDNILQPYTTDKDFRSPNVRADKIGYRSYVFDMRR